VRTFSCTAHPDGINASIHECDHVACAWEAVERAAARGERFDMVHDHSAFTALAMADQLDSPVLHTIHGPFTGETSRLFERRGGKARLVAIGRSQATSAPPGVRIAAVVPDAIEVQEWPLHPDKDETRR
jgi:Glycosyltransferase Family 4